jgi:RNA polymerase subunit RPABC4/transcription elongation factor Spt4
LARYRLRFQLQEIDLFQGRTVLGRSPDCHVTIEDPLVSRQHACVTIQGDVADFEDLGSRNGSKVNGQPARGKIRLKDADRLRIGTQELVFCLIRDAPVGAGNKATGFLLYCAQCKLPYPEEMPACPNCGAHEKVDEETTLSGVLGDDHSSWALQLLVDVLERAMVLDRPDDADKIMRRAAAAVEECLLSGLSVDEKQLRDFSAVAVRMITRYRTSHWAMWLLGTYARLDLVPEPDVVENLRSVPPRDPVEVAKAIDRILRATASRGGGSDANQRQALLLLDAWRKSLGPAR